MSFDLQVAKNTYKRSTRLKKKWTGIWWKNPRLRYKGVITRPPVDKLSSKYKFWKRCAWALIYNPNTPVWLRVILQEQVKYRRPFDKKEYKSNRWLRLFYRKWSKTYPKIYLLKRRSRWVKVDRYHRKYKALKKVKKFQRFLGRPLRGFKLGTKGPGNYFNTKIDMYRLNTVKAEVMRLRRRRKPSVSSIRYTSNIYTIKYLRKTQFSLLLSNIVSTKYSTRTTFFNNILPLKTLKSFLLDTTRVSWKKLLLGIDSSVLRFLYKNNINLGTFTYFAAVAKGLIQVNNKLADIRQTLQAYDLITLKKQLWLKKFQSLTWSISNSWLFWKRSARKGYSFIADWNISGIVGRRLVCKLFLSLRANRKEIYKPYYFSPRKLILETSLLNQSKRRVRKLSYFRPAIFKRRGWRLLRGTSRQTVSKKSTITSYLYTYSNPKGVNYNVAKFRKRGLFEFVYFFYKF